MTTTPLASSSNSAGVFRLLAAVPMALLLGVSPSANALQIVPTFGAGFNTAAQNTILNTIAGYDTLFTNNIRVNIGFENVATGLGASSTLTANVSYENYLTALRAHASSAADATAMSYLAQTQFNPVNGGTMINMTLAGIRAVGGLGLNLGRDVNDLDSTVSLNLGLMNYTRSSIDSAKYDLQSIASHEINEVLGTASGLGDTHISPIDLFRYTAAGARTFTTAGDDAYFSIDGTTRIARFNQNTGGDYGDYWSIGAHTPQVQDAFGAPGTFSNLGAEVTALDVVGYDVAAASVTAVPEPQSYALMLAGLGLMGWVAKRRKA